MPTIPNELIEKLSACQTQIWQTTSSTVSEAANQAIAFNSPLTVAAKTADLYAEMSVPMMVIQFAFSSQPENAQVILIPQDTVITLVELTQGNRVDEIDENIVADLRAPLEAIVQGLCLGIGSIRNDMLVASGLSIRFQIFSFPPNLQKYDTIVRTQVALSADDLSGSVIWLMDTETAHFVLGIELVEEDSAPFPKLSGGTGTEPGHSTQRISTHETSNSLDLLLDIPLEISVELGRVKMLVKEVLDLGTGSILEIDKAAGEPVDVLVNGRLVARGEVVVIEDNFGVRITEVVNPNERLSRPGEAA